MKVLKTGDPCPCCGRPIALTGPVDLLRMTETAELLGLPDRRETAEKEDIPLTLDELRELDGEPVWVKCLESGMGHLSCWGIRNSDCVDGYHTNYGDTDYGKGWLAYRRKPETSA